MAESPNSSSLIWQRPSPPQHPSASRNSNKTIKSSSGHLYVAHQGTPSTSGDVSTDANCSSQVWLSPAKDSLLSLLVGSVSFCLFYQFTRGANFWAWAIMHNERDSCGDPRKRIQKAKIPRLCSLFRSFSCTHLSHRLRKTLDLSFLSSSFPSSRWCKGLVHVSAICKDPHSWVFTNVLLHWWKTWEEINYEASQVIRHSHEALKIVTRTIYNCIIKSLIL